MTDLLRAAVEPVSRRRLAGAEGSASDEAAVAADPAPGDPTCPEAATIVTVS
jgi:hypothetical protein